LLHLGADDRIFARPPQTRQVGVVDDAILGRIPPMRQRFMEKAFHSEPIEKTIKLQITDFRIAKV
jgi:hypothetical protein